MNIFIKTLICLYIFMSWLPLISQEQLKINKKVSVVNIEVPVRILDNGNPVQGLIKETFTLYVNGRERDINGFNEIKKKIQTTQAQTGSQSISQNSGRLFLLIFNISDYHIDTKKSVDYIFEKVLRPGDRLMVLSNNFFLSDRLIVDIKETKKKVDALMRIELKKNRLNILAMENNLRSQVMDIMNKLGAGASLETSPIDEFAMAPDIQFSYIKDFFSISIG